MNYVNDSSSLDTFWEDLIYVVARLRAEPTVKHLAPPAEVHLDVYEALAREDRKMRKEKVMLRAQKKTTEGRVDDLTEELRSAALYSVKQDVKDSRYSQLFTMNLSRFKSLTLVARKEEFLRMKTIVKLPQYSDEFRDAQNLIVDQALSEINQLLAAQKAFDELEMFHRVAVQDWKDETNAIRIDIYAELLQIHGQLSKASKWARTFFPLTKNTKKLSAEEQAHRDAKRLEKKEKKLKDSLDKTIKETNLAKEKLAREQAKSVIDTAGGSGSSPPPPA